MVTFLIPRSQTLDTAQCPNHLAMVHNEKEPLRVSFHRTASKSPERVRRRTDSEEKSSRPKSANRNSWFKSITSSFMSGGGSPRAESAPSPPLDDPTHVRRRTRSLGDPKVFTSRTIGAEDPRLPDHMRRPELQLRRIQRRDLPSSKSLSNRSSSVDRTQKYPSWWSV
jgi:hypothetical protein